jgi:hypothetical protein
LSWNAKIYDKSTDNIRPKKTLGGIMPQAKGDCPDRIHSDQMVVGTVRREAGPGERWPKALKTKLVQGGAIGLKSTLIR